MRDRKTKVAAAGETEKLTLVDTGTLTSVFTMWLNSQREVLRNTDKRVRRQNVAICTSLCSGRRVKLQHFFLDILVLGEPADFSAGAGIMEADNRQVTTVFTVQPSFHHRHYTSRVS